MSKRTKIIIGLVIGIIVILLIAILIWWRLGKETAPVANLNTNQGIQLPENLPPAGSTSQTKLPPALAQKPDLTAGLKAVAMIFTERFGSYSNESNFSNLESLDSLMTAKMKAWAQNYKASRPDNSADQAIYSGVTTKALNVEIKTFEESSGKAAVSVNTQRQKAEGTTVNPEIYYQKLDLLLLLSGSDWLVDEAKWE